MNKMVFSWAEDANGIMVHVDSVSNGLKCCCTCPCCHESLKANQGRERAHSFAHHSDKRRANLKNCYMVTMYKLAEQIIQQEKKIRVPSYYGIFKEKELEFTDVVVDSRILPESVPLKALADRFAAVEAVPLFRLWRGATLNAQCVI